MKREPIALRATDWKQCGTYPIHKPIEREFNTKRERKRATATENLFTKIQIKNNWNINERKTYIAGYPLLHVFYKT